MTDKIILDTSDEAAKPHTINGWVSSRGLFYKEEDMARYDGCTHRACLRCGEPAEKSYTACPECREVLRVERYNALPKEKYDGCSMIYSEFLDQYFGGLDEVIEYLEDMEEMEGKTLADLQLLICEPQYASEIDCNDYLQDVLAEDNYAPQYIEDAFEELNVKIRQWKKEQAPLSYYPSKRALLIENETEKAA